ncbi:hypothetical protein FDG2_5396 [Candidatus Protofrankia californiensis]|uniref:Signal recognition particle protein n=1 Tax=Candidatus Protofrankia californiensis TaxID=1839754 RepID=A0A1C3PCY5_9ACTN|nr:hypothetical protein FDG2_5396 [Candidatus Protofrankia californiensis]
MTVTEVNQLLDRFEDARKVMKQMAGGLGGPGGAFRAKTAANRKAVKKAKGAKRKGNPAARAAQTQAEKIEAETRRAGSPPGGLPAGLGNGELPDLSALMRGGGFPPSGQGRGGRH